VINGEQIVACAREYIGTPWYHTGRLKGIGIDCAGLIYCVLNELGFNVQDSTDYTLDDQFDILMEYVNSQCDQVSFEDVTDGDILVFRARMMYNHCGFYTSKNTVIHAYNSPSVYRVVEQLLDEGWISRIYGVYRVKENQWPH